MRIFYIMLFLTTQLSAAPILNKNVAADGTIITIWPDHKDPDQFYFAPNSMKLSTEEGRGAKFNFMQFKTDCRRNRYLNWTCQYKAMMTALFVAGHDSNQLNRAQESVRKIRPNARFSTIPYIGSQVEFDQTLGEFVIEHNCTPRGGQSSDEVPCSIIFNKNGITNLMPFLSSGSLLPFKFVYQIAGVIEVADGTYRDQEINYGLTVNLGGDALKNHPELTAPFIWENH